MKNTIRTLALVAIFASPSLASAQQRTTPVSFGVSGGLSLPVGDLGDAVDAGYNITGHIWLSPASFKTVSFRGDVSYDNWSYKKFSASTRNLGVVANAIIHPSVSKSTVVPYIIGGVGFFNGKSFTTVSSSRTSSDPGVQVGGGIEFKLSGFSTFAEAKFVNVFTNGNATNWVPITFGVRF